MSGVPNQPFCWTPLPLAVQVSQEQSCPDQSVGNRTSFRSGGGPSQLSVRKSFSILGWPSKVIPNISNVSRSKLSTPGQTEIRAGLGRVSGYRLLDGHDDVTCLLVL